jgi:hypothetical protein
MPQTHGDNGQPHQLMHSSINSFTPDSIEFGGERLAIKGFRTANRHDW